MVTSISWNVQLIDNLSCADNLTAQLHFNNLASDKTYL